MSSVQDDTVQQMVHDHGSLSFGSFAAGHKEQQQVLPLYAIGCRIKGSSLAHGRHQTNITRIEDSRAYLHPQGPAGILMHHAVYNRVSRLGQHGDLLLEESRNDIRSQFITEGSETQSLRGKQHAGCRACKSG